MDPQANFALAPGVGLTHAFSNGVAPYLELNAISYVGRATPTWGSA